MNMKIDKLAKLTELYGKGTPQMQLKAARLAKDNKYYNQAKKWLERLLKGKEFEEIKGEVALELGTLYLELASDVKPSDSLKGEYNGKARKYLEMASNEGNSQAMYLIGFNSIYPGPDKIYIHDEKNGLIWIEAAASRDNLDALNELGKFYIEKRNDYKTGIENLDRAAELGSIKAIKNLISAYKKQDAVENALLIMKWELILADLEEEKSLKNRRSENRGR